MMNVLKEAAKSCAKQGSKEQMKFLAQAFLTHRQMGESEAYYRILPDLNLCNSNIATIFVNTGFPSERVRFLRRIVENKGLSDELEVDSSEELEQQRSEQNVIMVSI